MHLEGYIEKIVFHNEENGYTVLSLSDADSGEEITCTGNLSFVNEGQFLSLEGEIVVHKNYGEQFNISSYESKQPDSPIAMEKYLGSGAIKGIGEALAARIVKKFGSNTFDIIDKAPEKLALVKGISEKKARSIAEQFAEKRQLRNATIYLQQYNIPMNLSVKIYKKYGEKMYQILDSNPYRLAEDIEGVGFKTADMIASSMGISADSEFRVKAGMNYALYEALKEGDCYQPLDIFIPKVAEMLHVNEDIVAVNLEKLSFDKDIVIIGDEYSKRIYLSEIYYMERNVASMLFELDISFKVNETDLGKQISHIEKKLGIELDDIQRDAVIQSVKNGIMIVTGGPGTGKTTTINAIIEVLKDEGMTVLLAAPTGRAAKRMTETSGYEAQTIHRLLEINANPEEEETGRRMRFTRDEMNPLECDVVIVDEMSMVDIFLFNALLKAIVPGMRLIMVGDANQLPSVGPGNVLKDMINSGFCSCVRLEHIFRQAAKSDIVQNAHKINHGEKPVFDNKSKDFFMLKRDDIRSCLGVVLTLAKDKIPNYVHANPYDIQVLAPMRKGELGVENLNKYLQESLNPKSHKKREYDFRGTLFREGDKIMQIKNDYLMEWRIVNKYKITIDEGTGIFNGDMGVIESIDEEGEYFTCVFDGNKEVIYPFSELENITLAYAVTIHKSQGSEYPAVIMPILSGPPRLLNRNILYTAVTRAKKCVILVGRESTVMRMIDTLDSQKRYSSLEERLREE